MPPDKPTVSRQYLEKHGMTYTERVLQHGNGDLPSSLPAHIESFRQALLDFGGLVTDSRKSRFETAARTYLDTGVDGDNKSLKPPASAYLEDPDPTSELSADLWRQSKRCIKVAKKAKDLIEVQAPDHEWQHLLRYIFKRYGDVFPLVREQQKLFDQFSLEENILWDDMKKYVENCPKPDFTYGYTITKGTARLSTELVTNFSLEVLGDLRTTGLISSPLGGLDKWSKDKATVLSRDQFICFPWAVVERHPREVSIESEKQYSYCQAANGALAALRLNEELSSWATGSYDTVPPVVAFTYVGTEVRVWLAYSEIKDNIPSGHKMVCIWESSLCLDWGVIATCAIVKNMILWASRVWKPQLSGYISRIQRSKLSFSPGSHGTKPAMLSFSARPSAFSANSTQPTSHSRPGVTKFPVFEFGVQRPAGPEANDEDLASKTSIFEFDAKRPSVPKGDDQGPAPQKNPLPKTSASKTEGFKKGERQKRHRHFLHGKSIIVRLPNVNYDEIRESKQKQENTKSILSHASPAADANAADTKKKVQSSIKMGENSHKLNLNCGTLGESTISVEKLNKQINSLGLSEVVQATRPGIKPPLEEEDSQVSDVIAEGTNIVDSRDTPQGGRNSQTNLENPPRKTAPIDKSSTAADPDAGSEGSWTDTDCESQHVDGNIDNDFQPPGKVNGHDNSHNSHALNSEVKNDNKSLFARPSELDTHEGQERRLEGNEDSRDSPDEPEHMIGTCPHYGRMAAESLQLLWGGELLRLNAVSKIILEIQGLELLDATWSVLELWVAQHINVPSPCKALENIIRELNGVLEFSDAFITAEQMWASEPGTWRSIDKAMQSLLQSEVAKLKDILVWAIECMDLLESLELCHILKLGELSCLELKRMDREIIDLMLQPADSDPSTRLAVCG